MNKQYQIYWMRPETLMAEGNYASDYELRTEYTFILEPLGEPFNTLEEAEAAVVVMTGDDPLTILPIYKST